MPEQTVWRGTSSQWKNLGAYLIWSLACCLVVALSLVISEVADRPMARLGPFALFLLMVPFFIAMSRYLKTKNKVYELTTERLKTTDGIFSKVTDTLELYRVKDLETRQPFFYRLVGVENVQLNTSDASSPFLFIEAIPSKVGLADKIRNQVEAIRTQKGVREIDVE